MIFDSRSRGVSRCLLVWPDTARAFHRREGADIGGDVDGGASSSVGKMRSSTQLATTTISGFWGALEGLSSSERTSSSHHHAAAAPFYVN